MSGGELFVDEAEASEEYQREKEDEEESEQKAKNKENKVRDAEQSDEDDVEMGEECSVEVKESSGVMCTSRHRPVFHIGGAFFDRSHKLSLSLRRIEDRRTTLHLSDWGKETMLGLSIIPNFSFLFHPLYFQLFLHRPQHS
ncbi:hypothetical protein AALP_AAs42753U000400 [Arabis alpina]|uniref:Uncharacterized protein n=1 Tax=Arabis alpina TaxID=50452 RepID=A0A087G1E9_ARAAL|nr:hypothetical protein AALP_AAs42753U000400 [Arabis alpina]